jgi:hypothetical protein
VKKKQEGLTKMPTLLEKRPTQAGSSKKIIRVVPACFSTLLELNPHHLNTLPYLISNI